MKDSTKNIIANIIGLIILGINVYMYFWQDEGLTSFLTILGVSLALFMFKGTQTKEWLEKALGKFLSK
jgi:type III secretory pathway component EscS